MVQIKAHVFSFGLLVGLPTTLALAYAYKYSSTDDELRAELARKFPERMDTKSGRLEKEKLQAYFNNLRDPTKKADMDTQLDDVLKGGAKAFSLTFSAHHSKLLAIALP
jgi:hypothetical protein